MKIHFHNLFFKVLSLHLAIISLNWLLFSKTRRNENETKKRRSFEERRILAADIIFFSHPHVLRLRLGSDLFDEFHFLPDLYVRTSHITTITSLILIQFKFWICVKQKAYVIFDGSTGLTYRFRFSDNNESDIIMISVFNNVVSQLAFSPIA